MLEVGGFNILPQRGRAGERGGLRHDVGSLRHFGFHPGVTDGSALLMFEIGDLFGALSLCVRFV